MSRNSKKNRDARKRKQQRRDNRNGNRPGDRNTAGGGPSPWGEFTLIDEMSPRRRVERLLREGIDAAANSIAGRNRRTWAQDVGRVADRLTALEGEEMRSAADAEATRILESAVDTLFASGWQPTELVHAVRKDLDPRAVRLVTTAIGYHAVRTGAYTTAPEEWLEQLRELTLPQSRHDTGLVAFWRQAEGGNGVTEWSRQWKAILMFFGLSTVLPRLDPLLPVPGDWGRRAAPVDHAGVDPRALARIRGLLAKAESTTFPEEAEALTAKAQEQMTRYAVDSAMVDAKENTSLAGEVRTRRLLIDNPYPEAKVQLLQCVGDVNNVRVLWHESVGLVSCVGMPVDLDLCELLYTSLLMQSSNAMADVGHERAQRAPSFRRSFLTGYAIRIGERLQEAQAEAEREGQKEYGTALVPIMRARAEAVGDVFSEQFPDVVSRSHSVSNVHGWHAGRVAAEFADLTGHRERIDG